MQNAFLVIEGGRLSAQEEEGGYDSVVEEKLGVHGLD